MSGPGPALLGVEQLTVRYRVGDVMSAAVRGVSLEVRAGETLGLVGESGSGKSSIGLALARALPDTSTTTGTIRLGDTDVSSLQGAALRRWWSNEFAMVYQEPGSALNPTMRVGEQIAEVLRVTGASKQLARQGALTMIDRVALGDPEAIARRYPHQLSGGQQQRVVIAMALAVQPRLLVLDEPTTGLDATVEQEILTLVARPAPRPRRGDRVHHPRLRPRRGDVRSGGRAVRRRDRRAGHGRGGVATPTSSVHRRAADQRSPPRPHQG